MGRHLSGADWDAESFAFLRPTSSSAPRFTLALSSESTQKSYDAHFLRNIAEAIDKPVKLGGILDRARLETMRRTGFKQAPQIFSFDEGGARGDVIQPLLETVLTNSRTAAPSACPRPSRGRSSSCLPLPCKNPPGEEHVMRGQASRGILRRERRQSEDRLLS